MYRWAGSRDIAETIGREQALLLAATMRYFGIEPSHTIVMLSDSADLSANRLQDIIEDNNLYHLSSELISSEANRHVYSESTISKFSEIISSNRTNNAIRNVLIKNQILEIVTTLTNLQIKPVFLKGAVRLFDNVYRGISDRRMADIDILIASNDIEKAINALKDIGYEYYKNPNASKDPDEFIPSDHHHYPTMVRFDKKTVASIEIHHQLGSKTVRTSLPATDIISQSISVNANENSQLITVPSDEHQALHAIIHTSHLLVNGQKKYLPIMQIIESLLLLKKLDNYKPVDTRLLGSTTCMFLQLLQCLTKTDLNIVGVKDKNISYLRKSLFTADITLRNNGSKFYPILRALNRLLFRLETEGIAEMMGKRGKKARIKRFLNG